LTTEEFSVFWWPYEPVWAIGTGPHGDPEICRRSSSGSSAMRGGEVLRPPCLRPADSLGGSVKPDNIQGLMAQEELDGALVGGASLDPKSFAALVNFT